MNLATWSIRNPIPSILFFIMMTILGIFGFKNLAVQSFPDLDLPTINVTLALPGAAPSQLETEIAFKVENALATLSGLKHMTTSITSGVVNITVEFVLEKSLSDALIETKDAVDGVRSELPSDLNPPTVSAIHVGGNPVATYAIQSSKMNEEALSWFVDDTISKTLLSVKGVGKFDRVGGVDREIRVEVDPVKMASLGVTATEISKSLKQVQLESSGGRGKIGQLEQSMRTIATVNKAQDLAAFPIALLGGRKIRLDQLATIKDTYSERSQAALLDGKSTVGFRIYRAKGFDETKIVAAGEIALDKLKSAHPDLNITEVNNTVNYTLEQYKGSMHMLYEGAILTVLVVWFFLRDWRATLISATALPLSIIPTFAIMNWLGFSLNKLTLLAQAVVVGILVDDAIVEIENIVRHKLMGKSVKVAAEEAVNEIALAVMATTLTLVVVFLPTSLMSGISGLFFHEFGWTIVISVLISLLVARLLTPIMAIYFLKEEKTHSTQPDGKIMSSYLHAVKWCLNNRGITLTLAVIFFITSIFLAKLLPTGFIPSSDRGYTVINFEMPPGTSINSSLKTAELARKAVKDIQGIKHIFTTVGNAQAAGRGRVEAGEVRKGTITLALEPIGKRRPQVEIENEARQKLLNVPGARFNLSSGGPGEKMPILLSGDNTTTLINTAHRLEKEMRKSGIFNNISSTASLERPEIIIKPIADRAAELGVTTQTIADTIRVATAGDFTPQLSKLNLDNRQVYINVRMPDKYLHDISTISSLKIPTKNGSTTLATIANISMGTSPSQIDRYDRNRYVTVTADLGGMPLGKALTETKSLPAIKEMPSSVKLINTGDAEIMAELFSGFSIAILTGIMCVFCVLVILFKDFFQPITILSALPLSVGGAIIALIITGKQMSLPAMIGIVMLMGIVTKNSILLVEYTIVGMRDRGLNRIDAILDACHKRARPIIMTTIAMIAGMLPITLGFGGDASFRQPMAIAVVGGLITSTALSLLVVPVTFTYINVLEQWFGSKFKKKHL